VAVCVGGACFADPAAEYKAREGVSEDSSKVM